MVYKQTPIEIPGAVQYSTGTAIWYSKGSRHTFRRGRQHFDRTGCWEDHVPGIMVLLHFFRAFVSLIPLGVLLIALCMKDVP